MKEYFTMWAIFTPDLKKFVVDNITIDSKGTYCLPGRKTLKQQRNLKLPLQYRKCLGVDCDLWVHAATLYTGSATDPDSVTTVLVGVADIIAELPANGPLYLFEDSDLRYAEYYLRWLIPFCRATVDIHAQNGVNSGIFYFKITGDRVSYP